MKKLLLDKKELEHCKKRIEEGIDRIVSSCGAKGAIVGLSGGIDSALVFQLACESGIKVHALIMPEEGISSEEDVSDAIKLAEDAGAEYSIIRINPMVKAFDSSFPWDRFGNGKKTLALGNAKARIRMICNYMAANSAGFLVLGTGNRTEILLGYATKYGDGGIDLQPIGSLYKTQVRALAPLVNVPKRIIDKVPTAGLWKGQTDEGELGASYADMDRILFSLVEENKTVEETAKGLSLDRALVSRLLGRMKENEHKRNPPLVIGSFD